MKYVVVKGFDFRQAEQMRTTNSFDPLEDYLFDALVDTNAIEEDKARRIAHELRTFVQRSPGAGKYRLQEFEHSLRDPKSFYNRTTKPVSELKVGDKVEFLGTFYEITRKGDGENNTSRVWMRTLRSRKTVSPFLSNRTQVEVLS